MNATPIVRQHPAGGHTVAVPVPGSITARIYVGQHQSPAAAFDAARALGALEGQQLLGAIRAAAKRSAS